MKAENDEAYYWLISYSKQFSFVFINDAKSTVSNY